MPDSSNKNDFYKRFDTLEGTYRSFKNTTAQGAKALATLAPITTMQSRNLDSDLSLYTKLIDILFPVSAGSCKPIESLWTEIENLSKVNDQNGNVTEAKAKIARILRVYHYNGDTTASDLENKIQDFYKDVRPSAYLAPSSVAKKAGSKAPSKKEFKNLRDMIGSHQGETPERSAKLSMILVDTPIIDVKLRGTEKVDAFINYSPTILISQCVPYVDVRFILSRKAKETGRPLTFMGPLKFLMDTSEDIKDGTANALLYDSSVLKKISQSSASSNDPMVKEDLERNKEQSKILLASAAAKYGKGGQNTFSSTSTKKPATPPNTTDVKPAVENQYVDKSFMSGMETFMMPQTLINMDFDQTTVRYHPIRNRTLPFGTVVSFAINVVPSVGLLSFKTATLTLKIFDRSRLVEIADFINPKLYQAATLWITYGWRGPAQTPGVEENPYIKFINENMMKREAFGVRNTSVSIDDAGVTTVVLNLFTKGTAEMTEAVSDGLGQVYDSMKDQVAEDMANLSRILKELGIQSFNVGGADIRGSVLINAAAGGTFPDIDAAEYKKQVDALLEALKASNSSAAKEAKDLLNSLFEVPGKSKDAKPKAAANLEKIAKTISSTRFEPLKKTTANDLFTFFSDKFKDDAVGMPGKDPPHRLNEIIKQQENPQDKESAKINIEYNKFGSTSFGRVFLNYFQQLSTGINGVVDEFQVIFYRFNSQAGYVGSMNIAEFPIDMAMLEKAYTNKITEQKGERMSILNFLEIVRESQFNEMRHRAFGLSKFFQYKDGKYALDSSEQSQKEFQKATFTNVGNQGSFIQPAIDFYVETAYVNRSQNSNVGISNTSDDLLRQFESASSIATTGNRSSEVSKIMRIHIFDKAATPHQAAATIMKQADGKFVSINSNAYKNVLDEAQKIQAEKLSAQRQAAKELATAERLAKSAPKNPQRQVELARARTRSDAAQRDLDETLASKLQKAQNDTEDPVKATNKVLKDANTGIEVEAFDFGDKPSFQQVKNKIAEFVPTILIGSNGTAVQNVSYSSNQDALLSTIMMLRNNTKSPNPAEADGSGGGGLPLRVVPGQLSLTTLGCPLIDYMQQYFVDLGTGTTIDNLYNITGLTHNFAPGNYKTEIKFSFYDAYGQYENPQQFVAGINTLTSQLEQENKLRAKSQGK